MNVHVYEYQRSRSFTDLGPSSLRFNISKFLSVETAGPIEAKLHLWRVHVTEEQKFVQMVTWPIWPPCSYMVKNLKILFSRTKRPMSLNVGMQHQVFKYYQVCSNDAPGVTLI